MNQSIIIVINVLSALLLIYIAKVNGASRINKHLNDVIGKSFNFPDYDSSTPLPGLLLRLGNNDQAEDTTDYDYSYDEDYYQSNDIHTSDNKDYASTTISNVMAVKAFPSPLPATNQNCHCVPLGTCKTSIPPILELNLRIMTGALPTSMGTIATTTRDPSMPNCLTNTELCCDQSSSVGNTCGIRHSQTDKSLTEIRENDAPYGYYPWQATLLRPVNHNDHNMDYIGSGVLISNSHVLTVAHKLIGINDSALTVRLGEWNMENNSEQFPAEDFHVLKHIIHPEFELASLKNDIAILKLNRNVTLGRTPTIGTICLGNITFFGSKCWLSGWGRDSYNHDDRHDTYDHHGRIQKHIELPILQNSTCQQQLSATRLGQSFRFDTQSFLCAGGEIGKDACTGDGGAPLVCYHQSSNKWYLAGLVAWGVGCGQLHVPGVYINVHNYIPWIQKNMN